MQELSGCRRICDQVAVVHLRWLEPAQTTVDTLRQQAFAEWEVTETSAFNTAEVGLPPVARSGSGERRVVDQTGIEPVTS